MPKSPLYPMINALKASIETISEEPLQAVHFSFNHLPFTWQGHNGLNCELDIALKQANLQGHRSSVDSGPLAATRYSGQCNSPYHYKEPDKIILTVENTRHSLTATLWYESCGDYVPFEGGHIHSYALGQNARDECRRSPCSPSCGEDLRELFRHVTNASKHKIKAVVVFGEAADDCGMKRVLRDVLEEKRTSDTVMSQLDAPPVMDPSFASSVEVAKLDWWYKTEPPQPTHLVCL